MRFVAPFIGRNRARFMRGIAYMSILTALFNLGTFVLVAQLPVWVFALLIVLVIFGSIGIAYLEERTDCWGQETLHIWRIAGWDPVELTQAVKEIQEILKDGKHTDNP
jgi:hypothetical protein